MLQTAFQGRISRIDTVGGIPGLPRHPREARYDYLLLGPEMSVPPMGTWTDQGIRRSQGGADS